MTRRLSLVAALALLGSTLVTAQIANPTQVLFNSADHAAIIPVGQISAGQPVISEYEGLLFLSADNPATATPIVAGPLVPKSAVTVVGGATPPDYRLSFAQMGITIPACTATPCPQYRLLVVANGPGGFSARAVADESAPFTATIPTPPPTPARPTNQRVS